MQSKIFRVASFLMVSLLFIPFGLLAASTPTAYGQASRSEDQKYVGNWAGSYTTSGGESNKLIFILSKDAKGQWSGTAKYTNQEGENTATFKVLQIADGKLKGKLEDSNGEVDITIEGQFQGDRLEGTFSVSPRGSTEVADSGTWKLTRSAAAK